MLALPGLFIVFFDVLINDEDQLNLYDEIVNWNILPGDSVPSESSKSGLFLLYLARHNSWIFLDAKGRIRIWLISGVVFRILLH